MHRSLTLTLAGALALSALASSPARGAPATGPEDRDVRALIDGMRDASTWGHPDQFGQYHGMAAYADGDYAKAKRLFEIGARYADKVSQLSLGLMYLQGQGVARDPVLAWAWTALAAERGYPRFVATRDGIWQALSAEQRAQAIAARDTLAATYDDAHAKPRMIAELSYYRSQITGSHTGVDSGVDHITVGPSGTPSGGCLRAARVGLRGAGCGSTDMYAQEQWDPKLYFQTRDAQYQGTVTVGALQPGRPAAAASAAAPTR